jgi:hypothetical protein
VKPRVYLDVDGVVNYLGRYHDPSRWASDYPDTPDPFERFQATHADGRDWWVVAPDYMGRVLQRLTTYAEVVWLSTWRHGANNVGQALGLPPLAYMTDGRTDLTVGWKWAAIREEATELVAAGVPVYWVEDFQGFNSNAQEASLAGVRCIDTWPSMCLDNAMAWRLGSLCHEWSQSA